MKYSLNISEKDFHEFYGFAIKTLKSRSEIKSSNNNVLIFFCSAVFGIVFFSVLKRLDIPFEVNVPFLVFVVILIATFYVYFANKIKKLSTPRKTGIAIGKQDLELDVNGITCKSKNHSSFTSWAIVVSLEETQSCFLIFIDTIFAHLVPKRSFASPEEQLEFIEYVNNQIELANKRMQSDAAEPRR